MSVINPNETSRSWRHHSRTPAVQLYLDEESASAANLVGSRVAGFPLTFSAVGPDDRIEASDLSGAAAAVIQVSPDKPQSIARFQALARKTKTPLIAAVYDPPLALVRSLVRAGAHDVVPLPLDPVELEASLAPIRDELANVDKNAPTDTGKVVSVIKSVGGVGATAVLSQLAIRYAQSEARFGRDACLIDLDVQFGDAAFQLGLRPKLSLVDLLEAGSRLDGELLRATTTTHGSGLKVIAAPPDMMPLESLSSEQLIDIVELATNEFGTVFLDLPTNWTNWSLSVLARSDLVLLVTEMTVASLHRARRQLDLIKLQELDDLDVRIVVNRFEKGLLKTLRPADVREALGRDIGYSIANDHATMRSAIDRGVPIDEVRRKTALAKDFDALDQGVAAAVGLSR